MKLWARFDNIAPIKIIPDHLKTLPGSPISRIPHLLKHFVLSCCKMVKAPITEVKGIQVRLRLSARSWPPSSQEEIPSSNCSKASRQ